VVTLNIFSIFYCQKNNIFKIQEGFREILKKIFQERCREVIIRYDSQVQPCKA